MIYLPFIVKVCYNIGMDKNELKFFLIDGKYYGGDQNWSNHKWMKLGGCSTVSFCEACICLAGTFRKLRGLYPYDPIHVKKQEFMDYFKMVFQYVYPGIGGLSSIERFKRMAQSFVDTRDINVGFNCLSGSAAYEDAESFIVGHIDQGYPVMYLMLKHKDRAFEDYEWHWFTVTGYERAYNGLRVEFATWGEKHSFMLENAWDTRKTMKGGLVAMTLPENEQRVRE